LFVLFSYEDGMYLFVFLRQGLTVDLSSLEFTMEDRLASNSEVHLLVSPEC